MTMISKPCYKFTIPCNNLYRITIITIIYVSIYGVQHYDYLEHRFLDFKFQLRVYIRYNQMCAI